mgnify:CR=1 FL=1
MSQYKLVVCEKPSVAQAVAAVLGAKQRGDGCLSGNGYIVSWCFGHLAEFSSADAYDGKYAKWRRGDLPILSRLTDLPYTEFNEIADTVFQMSRQLEEAEAAQVKFFQNASHELRTPLTAIRGYAEGIASGVMQQKRHVQAVRFLFLLTLFRLWRQHVYAAYDL